MKSRQDAWTEENDLLLAETVLRHVREGSTQLNAFEEVGDELNRTSAACGFRWNAVVRHQYEQALQLAKKQRKQRHRLMGKEQSGKKKLLYQPPAPTIDDLEEISLQEFLDQETIIHEPAAPINRSTDTEVAIIEQPVTTSTQTDWTLSKVIEYLQHLNTDYLQSTRLKSENARLYKEVQMLELKNKELMQTINKLENNTEVIQEDYETLVKIMNRARKLVLFEEEDTSQSSFKMDRNGNLEKLAE